MGVFKRFKQNLTTQILKRERQEMQYKVLLVPSVKSTAPLISLARCDLHQNKKA